MSLQHTALPGFILADLFRTSLIVLPEEIQEAAKTAEPEPAPEAAPVAIPYVGKNLHRIMIGVHYPGRPSLPPEALDFLLNVLKAIQRNIEHVAVVNFAASEPGMAELTTQLDPCIILLFGAHPLYASLLDDQLDFVLAQKENIRVMRVPALEKMMETGAGGRAMKGKLWGLLRQVFQL